MLHCYRYVSAALLAGILLALAMPVGAQDTTDRAKAMLNKGQAQFKALSFKAAKATLLKVDKDALSDSDKKMLGEYLTKADLAIRRQAKVVETYILAEDALRNNDLAKAKTGFEAAATSQYLHTQTRRDARARLAEVLAKMQAFEPLEQTAPARPAAPPAETPAAIAVAATSPEPKPEPEPALSPEQELEAMLETRLQKMAKAGAKEPPETMPQVPIPLEAVALPPTEVQAQVPQRPEPEPVAAIQTEQTQSKMLLAMLAQKHRDAEAPAGEPQEALPSVEEDELTIPHHAHPIAQTAPQIAAVIPQPQRPREEIRPQDTGILTRLQEQMRIAKQLANVEFEKAMAKSQEALAGTLSRETFESAINMARTAKSILEQNKRLYSSREYREKLARAEDQLTYIEMRRKDWEQGIVEQQRQQIEVDREQRIRRQEEQLERRIETLTSRARTLKSEQNHKEALELIKEILKLDAKNRWAGGQLDLLEQLVLLGNEQRWDRLQTVEEQKVLVDIRESEIPWYEILRYPRDWRELSRRRGAYAAGEISESPADMLVRKELARAYPKLEVDEMSLDNVIDFLRDYSGLSIHVKWPVLQTVGIEKDTTVTVHLTNVTFDKALRTILDDVGGVNPLGYIVDGGVITISTRDDLSGMAYATTRTYDIRDLLFRVPNFVAPTLSLQQAGQGGGGGGGGFGNVTTNATNEGPNRQQIIDDIILLIQETIDPTSWRPTGEIGSVREMQGQLVVTQTAENHRRLMTLINQLREAKAIQISVESRFITVNTGFLESIGVDMDFFINLGSTLNPGVVIDPATGSPVNMQLPGGSWMGNPANNNWSPMGIFQNNSFANMITAGSPFGTKSVGAMLTNSAFSIAGSFLDDIQVNFLIEATQAHHATRTLTAPRITLFNGQRSNLQIARQLQYVTEYEETAVTVQGSSSISFETEVTTQILNVGTVLDLEATVSADRRYVILTLHPQVSELIGFRVVEGLGFVELPEQFIQSVQTTVSIPDGGTLLIAGQKRSAEVEREIGVPLLSKIPIINRAFTNRGKMRDEETLLILIKPTIIIQPEEEELRFPPGM